MTALDQAFIRAFTRQDTAPLSTLPRTAGAARPSSVRVEPDHDEPRPPEVPRSVSSPRVEPAVSPATTTVEAEEPLPMVQPGTPSPQRVPLSTTLGGVWSALGRSPRPSSDVTARNAERETDAEPRIVPIGCGRPATSGVDIGSFCFSATTIESPAAVPVEESRAAPRVAATVERSPEAVVCRPTIKETEALPVCERGDVVTDISAAKPELSPTLFTPPVERDVAQSQPAAREFRPAWQVDHFTWPRVCRRLIARAANELDRLADALLAANARGQRVLGLAGCHRGEGATTMLLCAARRVAERGIKPLLVDADRVCPKIAKRLCLQPQLGWDETSDHEGRSLDQAIVEATSNNVAVLPIREMSEEDSRSLGDLMQLSVCLDTLREHYDMILIDLGPLEELGLADLAQASKMAGMIDALVLVHNDRITTEDQLSATVEQLAASGIAMAGIVENFVPEN